MDVLISFGGGAVYGVASVVTAQPLDTIKTLLQAKTTGRISFRELGIRGLYRGSLPLLIGGSTFRSAQFGVNEAALKLLPERKDNRPFSYQVILAGLAGGIGRGLVESPFEFYKVRVMRDFFFLVIPVLIVLNQVRLQLRQENFRLSEIYQGASVTIFRNAFLFGFFVINLDAANYFFPSLSSYAFVKASEHLVGDLVFCLTLLLKRGPCVRIWLGWQYGPSTSSNRGDRVDCLPGRVLGPCLRIWSERESCLLEFYLALHGRLLPMEAGCIL